MKKLIALLASGAVMLSAQAKEDVSVLYVGGSPDINTIGGVSIDSAVIAKSVKERTADFTKFLKQRFNKVRAVDGKDYTSGMSDGYDVTVFDGRPKAIRPAVRETDDKGRIIKYIRPAYLPDDFDRAAVCIAEMSEDLGRSVGTKNDWFCLCLDNYAHNWKKDHAIFNGPFKVSIRSEMLPTPENAKEYCPIYGYTLPELTEMWLVHSAVTPENGKRIGMVSRPWGYTDSPEAEIISSGVCAKSIDAVAIGRHGNFFHWGFAAKPSDMTEPAKAALANAIVYMKDFNGRHVIARKKDEGIATRDRATAARYTVSRACWKDQFDTNMKFYHMMDSMITAVKSRKAAGEKLLPADEMYLKFQAPEKPVQEPYDQYLQKQDPKLYEIFGEDEEEYARYYDKNRPYFTTDGAYGIVVDQDARSLKIANNDIRLLYKAVELLENGGNDAEKGRRLLERYTLCRFSTPAQWKSWLDANRDRMFFTESGGWLWLVDTLDPAVPGNDYSVRDKSDGNAPVVTAVPAGVTDADNPVALKAELADGPDGTKDVVVTMTVHDGFHTYATLADGDSFIPTEITVELPEGYEKVGELVLPAPSPSATATTYYTGTGVFRQRIKGSGTGVVTCKIRYQVCDASICMPPVTKTFDLTL
ncbi:protein-disulfide reductase DsbD domain-containing protein [uncultured Duncaniella sp.]|uniref:protein-disulfide reductase DsbD domain-containing protein n=1 Tax=uncultured Duncaniella sp. TaxID=2768039 RepID=UPI0026F3DFD2|nr:protein-disulfide reductase DsbD domain-containing protein [uncultured Duncaniella sp.]